MQNYKCAHIDLFSPYLSFLFLDVLHGGGENQIDEDSSSNSDSDHINQFGSGSKQNKFIEKIASLVSQKLQPPIATPLCCFFMTDDLL